MILSWEGLPSKRFVRRCNTSRAFSRSCRLDQAAWQGIFLSNISIARHLRLDDGYRDNFVCAFPILKQLGIPATIFLATGYVDSGQLPWYDQVRPRVSS